jgi:hypothetical protein
MSEWIYPNENDVSTWWPGNIRVLSSDKQGWIVIVMATENGFELDDGSEPGLYPVCWQLLPEPPK